FTAADREDAAEVYELLHLEEENAATLKAIAESLVIISIDQESKYAKETIKNLMLHADNKYFDKTIQIVITNNGQIGFNLEHTVVDGTSIATLVDYINQGIKDLMPWDIQNELAPKIKKKSWIISKELSEKLNEIKTL